MITDFKEYVMSTQSKKDALVMATSMPQYPTGYMYLDYGTGSYLTVYDDEESPLYQYHNVGITCGSVNTIIAKSQGGKTTLATSIAAAIIEPYVTKILYDSVMRDVLTQAKIKKKPEIEGAPLIQILDTEKTLPVDYAKKVTRYTNKLMKHHVAINPITTDKDLMLALNKHVQYKVTHMEKIPMPMLDIFGNPIMEYPPTVMIIDSMSQLLLEDCDDPSAISKAKKGGILDIYDSATQNTAGARRAKIITALYSQLVNYAKKYNIIIFSICHINKMLPVNGVPVKQYRGLRGGETIGGGEKAIFLAATILRLDVIKNVSSESTMSVNLGDGITGHIAIASWIKSKSNSKMNKCQIVYTNEAGYDPILSNLWYGKEIGDLPRSGNNFFVPGYEKLKFNMKNYREVFGDYPELFSAYYDDLRDKCAKLLDNPDRAQSADRKLLEAVRDDIHRDFEDDDDRGSVRDMDDIFANAWNVA